MLCSIKLHVHIFYPFMCQPRTCRKMPYISFLIFVLFCILWKPQKLMNFINIPQEGEVGVLMAVKTTIFIHV
jgi:hypothetical protein